MAVDNLIDKNTPRGYREGAAHFAYSIRRMFMLDNEWIPASSQL